MEWFSNKNLGSSNFFESEGVGTRYTDEVSIDAGLFTLPIYIYAFIFYSYRQMRWRKLVNLNFGPLNDQLTEGLMETWWKTRKRS